MDTTLFGNGNESQVPNAGRPSMHGGTGMEQIPFIWEEAKRITYRFLGFAFPVLGW